MTTTMPWVAGVESDPRFPLVEPACTQAGSTWLAWRSALAQQGFDDVDIRSLGAGHAPLAPHAHSYDLRVLVLAGGITLDGPSGPAFHGPGNRFELPGGTLHRESFHPAGYTYLAARRHSRGERATHASKDQP